VAEFGRPLGEELLEPTRIYAPDCLALLAALDVHALCHVTGGGLAANLARVLPDTVSAVVDRGTWAPPPVFRLLAELGRVPAAEMERTVNLGVGMLAVVPASDADRAVRLLVERRVPAWVAGEVTGGDGSVALRGSFRAAR
jgi:phosphoribosylformylglycinamidine cyclo-ligase